MRRMIVAFLVVLAVLATGQAHGKDVILVDASGSMKGFFVEGELQDLVRRLHDEGGGRFLEPWIFKSRKNKKTGHLDTKLLPLDESTIANGQVTLLDEACERAMSQFSSAGALWVLTDNLQDDGSGIGGIDDFYEVISSDSVKRGWLVVTKLPFRGPLYMKDGKTSHLREYQGERAVVLYVLQLRGAEDYEVVLQSSRIILGGSAPISFKPVGQLETEAVMIEHQDPRESDVWLRPEGNDDSTLYSGRIWEAGEEIIGKFRVRFVWKQTNARVTNPRVAVSIEKPFNGFTRQDVRLEVVPPVLWQEFVEGAESKDTVEVTIRFPKDGFKFAKSSQTQHDVRADRSDTCAGSVRVSWEVDPNKQLAFSEEDVIAYSTSDLAYFNDPSMERQRKLQTKVFGLRQLAFHAKTATVIPGSKAIRVVLWLRPPSPPIRLPGWFLPTAVAAAALFALGALFGRSAVFVLSEEPNGGYSLSVPRKERVEFEWDEEWQDYSE